MTEGLSLCHVPLSCVVEPPLQGSHDFGIGAQGVALGWYRPRPWRFGMEGMTEGQAFCHDRGTGLL